MAKYYVRPKGHNGKEYIAIGAPQKTEYGQSSDPFDAVDHPVARMYVHGAEMFPNFSNETPIGVSTRYHQHAFDEYSARPDLGADFDADKAWHLIGKTPDTSPDTLFTHVPATIEEAFSHSSMRHTVPILLAMAHKDNPVMQADASLSPHSSKLAQKGLKMGAIVPNTVNAGAEVRNDLTFRDHMYAWSGGRVSDFEAVTPQVPESDVQDAKRHLRTMLRPPSQTRKKVLESPQFDHPQLPGVDW